MKRRIHHCFHKGEIKHQPISKVGGLVNQPSSQANLQYNQRPNSQPNLPSSQASQSHQPSSQASQSHQPSSQPSQSQEPSNQLNLQYNQMLSSQPSQRHHPQHNQQ